MKAALQSPEAQRLDWVMLVMSNHNTDWIEESGEAPAEK